MTKIKDVRLLFPALVTFQQADEADSTIFVYVDQFKKEVIIPDTLDILNVEDFRAAFAEFYNSKNKPLKIPELPKNTMDNFTPDQFKV